MERSWCEGRMLGFALSHWLAKQQQVVALAEAAAKNQPADTNALMRDEPVLSVTCALWLNCLI